jgi:hypothetical protein
MMTPSEFAIERIRAYAKENNIAKSRLAVDSELDDKTLKNIFDESWNPQFKTMRQIEAKIPEEYKPDLANLNTLKDSVKPLNKRGSK